MSVETGSTPAPDGSRSRRPLIAVFTSHWLAMTGLAMVLTSVVLWLCLLTVHLRGGQDNPYIGVAMMAIGGLLVAGAIVAPIGLFLGRRRLGKRLVEIDRKAAWFKLIAFLLAVTALNVAIVSQTATSAVHHLESNQFCLSCHDVHIPEQRSFDQGPHAGIQCVDCHVGDGTLGFVKAKLQGTQQLWAVMTDSVHVPIETAIERGLMIPSAQTCEQCHWKEQPANAKLKLIQRYADDAANTPQATLLTMNIGGRLQGGIHGAHHGEGVEIRFVANDAARQDIPLVEYKNSKTGVNRTYVKTGTDASALASKPRITMQCFDCHNRPAHAFLMPDRAVDRAITLGRMSSSLPFLKKFSVEILKAEYATSATAATAIPAALTARYAKEYPEVGKKRAAEIDEAGKAIAEVYSRNVFPERGVKWGTYPDNRGHQDFPGCFRCHDGQHNAGAGETITNNCFRCHFPAAVGETDPKVLELLGVDRTLRDLKQK